MKLRQNPDIQLMAIDGKVSLYDSAKRRTINGDVLADLRFAWMLTSLQEWRPFDELTHMLMDITDCSAKDASAELFRFVELGILVCDKAPGLGALLESRQRWARVGWSAPFDFHHHTRELPKIDWADDAALRFDVAMMKKYVAEGAPPAAYKHVPSVPRIPLSTCPSGQSSILDAFENRTGQNVTADRPLDLASLGWLTWICFGQTGKRRLPVSGDHVTKTSPSGGSRHPTEVYAVVLDVELLANGVYHYNVKDHALDLLEEGNMDQFARKNLFLMDTRPAFAAKVVFVLCTSFERSMYRYRESRSYRVVHHDIGHLMQTFACVASSMRRRSYRAYTLRRGEVESMLRLDGMEESAMTYCVLG